MKRKSSELKSEEEEEEYVNSMKEMDKNEELSSSTNHMILYLVCKGRVGTSKKRKGEL